MNFIVTPYWTPFQRTTTSALTFIRMVGPPLVKFDPTKYFNSWLGKRT